MSDSATRLLYRVGFFTSSGDYAGSIVLAKGVKDAIDTLVKEESIENVEDIIEVALVSMRESKVLITRYNFD